jgi:DNA polymerase-3 subunit alpha
LKVQEIDWERVPILSSEIIIDEKLIYEKEAEYLGLYLSTNPFAKLRKEQKQKQVLTLTQLSKTNYSGQVIVNIKDIRQKRDRHNNLMAFVQISDDTESFSATIFSSLYETIKDQLNEDMIVLATIKIDNYNNQKRAIINKIDQ